MQPFKYCKPGFKKRLYFLSLFLLVYDLPLAQQSLSINVGTTTRSFIQYIPTNVAKNPSLVISMHGLGGDGKFQKTMYGLESIADKDSFIVVYPDGTHKISGSPGWDISGTSDVNFISTIIDTMVTRYKVDRNRVFATGFSMGGMMCYKLACTITEKIAAIAPASGYPMSQFGYDNVCTPTCEIPICHFHGTSDNVVTYSGLEAFVDQFTLSNGCEKEGTKTTLSSLVTKEHWTSCSNESEIAIYHFANMGHAYPTIASHAFSPNDTLWAFFKKHSRPSRVQIHDRVTASHTATHVSAFSSKRTMYLKSDDPVTCIHLFNMQGKKLYTFKTAESRNISFSIPVTCVNEICLIRIAGKNGIISHKVFVQ